MVPVKAMTRRHTRKSG
ncbi:hypothetical protein E2C01_083605 [Portunus trituberculatus]|uniref:Uncharacterized protein n=1 Tax=Portunus trituberculatus TaxID=210409 RepID=A0A5B7J5B6_PORTR|nr:hypothetical protein [Portunus trituberculatus]